MSPTCKEIVGPQRTLARESYHRRRSSRLVDQPLPSLRSSTSHLAHLARPSASSRAPFSLALLEQIFAAYRPTASQREHQARPLSNLASPPRRRSRTAMPPRRGSAAVYATDMDDESPLLGNGTTPNGEGGGARRVSAAGSSKEREGHATLLSVSSTMLNTLIGTGCLAL